MMEVTIAEEAIREKREFSSTGGQPKSFDLRLSPTSQFLGMYEAFFHLKKSPFGMNPDPNCLFMTPSHREAFAGLLYAVSRHKGFVVLTGDAGTGKTSLLRALMRSAADTAKFSLILTPRVSSDEFLEMALMDFGMTEVPPTKSQRIFKLQELLMELRVKGVAPVLIVDEAHTLSPETLEEIRLLTNFETSEEKLLQIVLAGQNDLAAILNRDDLRQLKQRIEVRMDLKPLVPADVRAYMEYRWARAGSDLPLPFSVAATALIVKGSRGIPRLVNSICDSALLLAYAGDEPVVGAGHIQQVLRDFDLDPEPARNNGRGSAQTHLNGKFTHEDHLERPGLVTRRPFSGIEDDGSPAKTPLAMRWPDGINFDFPQLKRDKQ